MFGFHLQTPKNPPLHKTHLSPSTGSSSGWLQHVQQIKHMHTLPYIFFHQYYVFFPLFEILYKNVNKSGMDMTTVWERGGVGGEFRALENVPQTIKKSSLKKATNYETNIDTHTHGLQHYIIFEIRRHKVSQR